MNVLLRAMMEDYRAGQYGFQTARRMFGMEDRSWGHLIEPAVLSLLATAAVGGVLTDPGAAFWAIWYGVAAACFLGVRWRRREAVQPS